MIFNVITKKKIAQISDFLKQARDIENYTHFERDLMFELMSRLTEYGSSDSQKN